MELHWRPPVGHRVGPVELADGVREDEVEAKRRGWVMCGSGML